jgi:hypothetical protein
LHINEIAFIQNTRICVVLYKLSESFVKELLATYLIKIFFYAPFALFRGQCKLSRYPPSSILVSVPSAFSALFVVNQKSLRSHFGGEKISHRARNIAAISGPITNPLIPKTAMPPRVEISTR